MSELEITYSFFKRERDGRWCMAIVPPGGTWKDARQVQAPKDVQGGTTKRPSESAKRWRDATLADIRKNGGQLPAKRTSSPTLRQCHAQLMKRREDLPRVKQSTIKNNWTHLRAQILPVEVNTDAAAAIADVPMAEIGVPRACAFLRAVRGRCSPNHTRNVYSTACLLWDTAQGEGLIGPTVPNPFRSPLVVAELPRQQNLEDDDGDPITIPIAAAQALLDAPDELVPLERRARYAVAVLTGADDGEIAGVKWKRLLNRRGAQRALPAAEAPTPYVQIRGQVSLRGKDGFASEDSTKTPNRERDIPIHPALDSALDSWAARWEQLMRRKPRPNDYLFPTLDGAGARPPSSSLLRSDLRVVNAMAKGRGEAPLVDEELLAKITFKAWRRTFSSRLEAAGVNDERRGRLMGHAGKTVTTRNYTAHELARLAEDVAKIPLLWRSVGVLWPTEISSPQESAGDAAKPEDSSTVGQRRGWDSNPRMTVLQSDPPCGGEADEEPPSATKCGQTGSPAIGMTGDETDGAGSPGVVATENQAAATEPDPDAAMPTHLAAVAVGLALERVAWEGLDRFTAAAELPGPAKAVEREAEPESRRARGGRS